MRAQTLKIVIYFLLFLPLLTKAQLVVSPPSTPCACDANFTYAPQPGIATFFILTDINGNVLESGATASGQWTSQNLCQGIYFISANASGTNFNTTIQINHPSVPIGAVGQLTLCSTGTAMNLSSSIIGFQPGGIWTTPAGNTFNGSYNPNTFSPGFYLYTIDNNGCLFYSGVNVNEIQNANPGIQTTYLICDTYTAFEMYDFLEGSPDPGGNWFGPNNQPMNGIYDPATMSSGLFVYAINNVPGCNTVFTTMFVDERATPNAGENSSLVVCTGAAAFQLFNHIPGNPDPGGFWFRPNGVPFNGVFQPGIDPAGNYRYVVTANAPCEDQESIISISYSTTDPSGLDASFTICESQNPVNLLTVLNGTPQSNGVWTNAQGQTINGIYDPQTMQSGTFNYYVNNIGCDPTGASVQVIELAAGEAGDDILDEICITNTPLDLNTVLSANADLGGTFRDAQGNVVSNIVNLNNTQLLQFTYEVATPSCPTDIANIVLAIVAPPVAPLSQNASICDTGQLVNLNDYYQTIVFPEWQDATGNAISPQWNPILGQHQFTITSASNNACPSSDATLTLQVNQPLFPSAQLSENVCIGDSPIDLNDYVNPTFLPLGHWENEAGQEIDSEFTLAAVGTSLVNFVGEINGSCPIDMIQLSIVVFPELEAGAGQTIEICEDHPVILLNDLLSEDADANGQWFLDNFIYASDVYIPMANDALTFEYVVSANDGCPGDAALFLIQVQEGFEIDAGAPQSVCAGSSPLIIGTTPENATSYSWFPITNLSDANSAQTTLIIANSTFAPQTLTYSLTAQQGVCIASDNVTIEVLPEANLSLVESVTICDGETVNLNVPQDLLVQWAPSELFENVNDNDQIITPENSVIVNVTATNSFGCSTNDNVVISVNPNPTIDYIALPASGCEPLMVEDIWLDAVGQDLEIQWRIIGENMQDQGTDYTFFLENAGLYSLEVQVTNNNGCSSTAMYPDIFEVYGSPVSSFTYGPENLSLLNSIAHFQNNSFGANAYLWDFGTGDVSNTFAPSYTFPNEAEGSYDVCLTALSEVGCESITCRTVFVEDAQAIFVPNAFTPDDDGTNDVFLPYLLGFDLSTYSLEIYDRWGTLIFRTNDIQEPWIGNINGGQHYAMAGIYNWVIQVKTDSSADFQRYEGHITVIR